MIAPTSPLRPLVFYRCCRFRLQNNFLRFQPPHGFLYGFDELRVTARDDFGGVLHHLDVRDDAFAFHGPAAVQTVDSAEKASVCPSGEKCGPDSEPTGVFMGLD